MADEHPELEQKIRDLETMVSLAIAHSVGGELILDVLGSERVQEFAQRTTGKNIMAEFIKAMREQVGADA